MAQRRSGPVGRIFGLAGAGVGMAAEYHAHRKAKKSPQHTPAASETDEGPSHLVWEAPPSSGSEVPPSSSQDVPSSSSRQQPSPPAAHPNDTPPAYSESVDDTAERRLSTGGAAAGDNKVQHGDEFSHDDDDDDEDDDSDSEAGVSDFDYTETLIDDDEEDWRLDELAASTKPPSYEAATSTATEDDLVREVLAGQQEQRSAQSSYGRLPCPVIIPQRRPRNKSRGFVRAYAPVLQNVNIDQVTFLKFLTNFHKSSQANPLFTVLMVSAGALEAVPSAFAMAISASVRLAAGAAREVDVRRKTNNFLDRMNDELFKPAGCFAFIMRYKTEDEAANARPGLFGIGAASVDLSTNQIVNKYNREGASGGMTGLAAQMKTFRLSSGSTSGPARLPEAAPLIFPEVDSQMTLHGNQKETFKGMAKDANKFMQSYMDRRAQIQFAHDDPNASLVVPESQRQMLSKLGDPTHPMYNSGPIGLLTGGTLGRGQRRSLRNQDRGERRASRLDRRTERRAQKNDRYADRGLRRLDRRLERRGITVGLGGGGGGGESSSHYEPQGRRRGGLISGVIGGVYNAYTARSTEVQTRGESSQSGPQRSPQPTPSPNGRGKEVAQERAYGQERGSEQDLTHGASGSQQPGYGGRRNRRGGLVRGTIKKMMTEDVLYLTIVNLPSEEELAEARAMLASQ